MNTDKLDSVLGISEESTNQLAPLKQIAAPVCVDDHHDVDQDYRLARENIHYVTARGAELFDSMVDLARESESPRAFEVAATLMNTIVSANKDLMNLHKQKKEAKQQSSTEAQAQQTTNNTQNIFVGTTAELQALLKKETVIENG